jgi:hypothetical protein
MGFQSLNFALKRYFSYSQSKLMTTRISEALRSRFRVGFCMGSSRIAHRWDWPIVSRLTRATTKLVNRLVSLGALSTGFCPIKKILALNEYITRRGKSTEHKAY